MRELKGKIVNMREDEFSPIVIRFESEETFNSLELGEAKIVQDDFTRPERHEKSIIAKITS